MGGALVGLIGVLTSASGKRWRWVEVALPFVFAAVGATAVALGLPRGVWLASVLLAGVTGVLQFLRLPVVGQACALLKPLQRPRLQSALLLVASPVVAVLWACSLNQALDAATLMGEDDFYLPYPTTAKQIHSPQTTTDRGYPVTLYAVTPEDELPVDTLLERENAYISKPSLAHRLVRTAPPDLRSNCHGWTFAGGRYWVEGKDVERILEDNGYRPTTSPRVGDVIIYRDGQGRINHSGVAVACTAGGVTLIESKWAGGSRFIHPPEAQWFSADWTYHHSTRPGHRLRGLRDDTGPV